MVVVPSPTASSGLVTAFLGQRDPTAFRSVADACLWWGWRGVKVQWGTILGQLDVAAAPYSSPRKVYACPRCPCGHPPCPSTLLYGQGTVFDCLLCTAAVMMTLGSEELPYRNLGQPLLHGLNAV